jgi:hypothetical protein
VTPAAEYSEDYVVTAMMFASASCTSVAARKKVADTLQVPICSLSDPAKESPAADEKPNRKGKLK